MKPFATVPVRAVVLLLSLAVSTGCASSGSGVPGDGTRQVNTQVQTDYGARSISLRTIEDIYVHQDTLAPDGSDVLRHLAATYDEKGLPLNTVNPEARLMGAVDARVRGDLGGRPISRYFRCGTSITGSIADQYEVYLTVVTQLEPLEDGRWVTYTHAEGFAVQGGRSGNDIRCATRGRLEREIFEHLQRKVRSQS